MRLSLFVLIIFIALPSWSRNPFVDSLNQKVEVKKKTRWTLADWLETKNKMSLMDAWLAANTSSHLFEFYLGGYYKEFTDNNTGQIAIKDNSTGYSLAGFVSIFGLNLDFEEEDENGNNYLRAAFILRLLGQAEQGTRLNLFYGQERVESEAFTENFDIPFYGASLRMYILSFLAIQGKYLLYQKTDLPNQIQLEGKSWEYGVAIDLGPFQISGDWFVNDLDYSSNLKSQREGLKLSLLLYM